MNLMLATLTSRDRFDAYLDQLAAESQIAPVPTRRGGGRIGLRTWAATLAGHLRMTWRGAGA